MERVRYRLERQAAEASLQPSRVTLRGSLTLGELLSEIERQSGNRLRTSRLPSRLLRRRTTVDFNREPFWLVMEPLSNAAGFSWRLARAERTDGAGRSAGDAGLGKKSGLQSPAPTGGRQLDLFVPATERPAERSDCVGAFRVAAAAEEATALDAQRLLAIQMRIEPEPRLRAIALIYAEKDFRVRSAEGVLLRPFSPKARSELPLGDGRRRLLFVASRNQKLRSVSLDGRVTVQVAAGQRLFRFRPLKQCVGQSVRRGGARVTVTDVRFRQRTDAEDGPAGEATVRIALVYDRGGPAFESYRTWMFHNRVWLERPDGSRVPPWGGFDTTRQADGAVGIAYRFRGDVDLLTEARFVYEAPTFVLDVPVAFRIEGLSLPTVDRTDAAGQAVEGPMPF
ncbi:MAG TPA: hypothetical protein EYP14_12610 [Planctomycetaceae bacterium]|nr:hypothetical protein [Planctomycetaceae bacterium]